MTKMHSRRLPWLAVATLLGVAVGGWPSLAHATTATPSTTATRSTPAPIATVTPTASPSPQRTGDLGTKQIDGRVYNALRNGDEPIADASLSFRAPGGSGSASTDATGGFSFPLFLHDTDLVTIAAAAAGFHGAEVSYSGLQLWLQTAPIVIRLVPVDPDTHRISGIVVRDPFCSANSRITLELSGPSGPPSTTTVSPSGDFAFEGLPDGDYVISAVPDCLPSYYAPVTVYVRGTDAYTELAFTSCPPGLVLDPAHGPPGTTFDVIGRCYYVHSGRQANLYLDLALIGEVAGDTPGNYRAQIRIPDDARTGWHAVSVSIPGPISGMLIGSGGFYVDLASPPSCFGDCDRDGAVTVDELLTMVTIALGNSVSFGCPAAVPDGEPLQISGIIAAVNVALDGCAGPQAGACYENSDCTAYEPPYAPFATDRGNCCHLWRTSGSVPFTWCPAEAFDATSGECSQCANPC